MPRKSKKSDLELRKNHRAKGAKTVVRIGRAFDSLGKILRSKHHPFTAEEKQKAYDQVTEYYDLFTVKMTEQKNESKEFDFS
jgi:hypothetical protein